MSLDLISARDVLSFIRQGDAVVIDLREKESYSKRHIPGAVSMPYDSFDMENPLLKMYDQLILCCDRGSVSLSLGRRLSEHGFSVYSLVGGMEIWSGPTISE